MRLVQIGAIMMVLSGPAYAQDPLAHHTQAGALLGYAEAEIAILYAALSAREFDVAFAKQTLDELERTLNDAKKAVDRVVTLLPDKQKALEPELIKLRDLTRQAEDQLRKLRTDVDEQTGQEAEEDDGELDLEDVTDGEEPGKADWDLLKNDVAWLGVDVKKAAAEHDRLGKKLGTKKATFPASPRGKRSQ